MRRWHAIESPASFVLDVGGIAKDLGPAGVKIRRLGVRAHKLLSEWMTGLIPFEKFRIFPVGQERHFAKATIFERNRMYGLRA